MTGIHTPVILIVDDDDVFIKALRIIFEKEKYGVLVGKNGEEGLELAFDKHPDGILLDLVMPKMGGIEMLTKLRKDSWGRTVPVVIMTNISTENDQLFDDVLSIQPTSYLIKTNTEIDEVVQNVKELLMKKN